MTLTARHVCLSAFAFLLLTAPLSALQEDPTPPPLPLPEEEPDLPEPDTPDGPDAELPDGEQAAEESESPENEGQGRGSGRGRGGPRPFDRVITDEAVTDRGIFTIHRINDTLYYEIPAAELGTEFLMVTRIAKTAVGAGMAGEEVDSRVVKWVRRENTVFLQNVSYGIVADQSQPIALAVEAVNTDAILMAFDIAAFGENESPVIDVTAMFAAEMSELSPRSILQARGFDRRRSYLDRARAFPDNIEVRAVHTYTRPEDGGGGGGGRGRGGMPPGSATLEMAFSMVKLPAEPMMPRLFDERVGYFTVTQTDYSIDEHRTPRRRYITRRRLEKLDPEADVSDPVEPIVYWIDPATPSKWVPYVKAGVEAWQPAFEAAGFSNAIIAREAPTTEEDPDWSPEDARHSVIRWLASTVENASGPSIEDPRTGEILDADVELHHNVQGLFRDWYFVQAAPLDPRAQSLPFPDALIGDLVKYVVSHEVGHTLGLMHNMKASSTYPLDKIRDPEWLREMGHTPSIMDYARMNYVAQPEDNVPVETLIPKIGPYDEWAIGWGYRTIPGVATPEDERPTIDQWARAQDEVPWYRFSTDEVERLDDDPGELREAVGDADAVEATRLGLKNLERVMDLLLDATSEPGRNWDELEDLYGRVLSQWTLELNHVAALVGGVEFQQKYAGQDGVLYTPVPSDSQRTAVAFLNENAFKTPDFLIRREILQRIEPSGVLTRIRTAQRGVLETLLDADRFSRLTEQQVLDASAYSPVEFLVDLRQGVWSELSDESVSTDAFRRNVQRLYLSAIEEQISGNGAEWDDMRAMLRGQLRALETEVRASIERAADPATRFHLEDTRDFIARLLNPGIPRREDSGGGPSPFGFEGVILN